MGSLEEMLASVSERLENVEKLLGRLVREKAVKDWYSTAEVAEILGRAEFTVREWCRLRRVHARKRACGPFRSRCDAGAAKKGVKRLSAWSGSWRSVESLPRCSK